MQRRVASKFGRMLFSIVFVSIVVFVLIRLSGDPSVTLLPYDATIEQREAVRHAYGWDQPIYVQYVRFLSRAVQGDFGLSIHRRQPALELVLERVPATFELAFLSMAVSIVIGVMGGVLTAVMRGTIVDYAATSAAFVGRSMPSFWLGLMLILLFAVALGWLPTSGRIGLNSRVLPIITLSSYGIAEVLLLVRQGMVEALRQDYVRTARAKGLVENAVRFRHALRNVLLPVVTVAGISFGDLLGGALITENVFAWPGMGRLALESVYNRDFPVIQAVVLFISVGIVVVNFLVDLMYGILDPRIRHAEIET